ncbi:PT domain-containing protein [Nocardioides sp. Root140]|uniref:PT domain-containing protein n=1 Tax=Nocardioides sp. Root140 TaxID=1736460 RepID=UPI000B0A7454|nr:PT domain-containing protein [Nocardioides sp. Root140]
MNRTAAMAIASAAVIGIVGGTYAATGPLDGKGTGGAADDSTGEPTSPSTGSTGKPTKEPSTKPSSTATDSPNDQPATGQGDLLYMQGGTIHDGDTEVLVSGFRLGDVAGLHRVAGGWLVVEGTSDQEPSYDATFVDPDGETTEIGSFFGAYDVNTDGDSIVAQFDESSRYEVRDARSGKIIQAMDMKVDGTPDGGASFGVGDLVVTAWRNTDQSVKLVGWNLYENAKLDLMDGMHAVGTAPQRNIVAGFDDRDPACLKGGSLFSEAPLWRNCDVRPWGMLPLFSPDGLRILGIPDDTEGFGPTRFEILDARNGRKSGSVKAPEFAEHAEWATNDSLFVTGYQDTDMNGGVIYRCSLSGGCETEVDSDQAVVLGSPG